MILLHRLTPFVIAGSVFGGFAALTLAPLARLPYAVVCFVLVPILLGRLLLWEFRRPAFWVFMGTPCLLLLSSIIFFLFLESESAKWFLTSIVTLAVGLYAENLFTFYHMPSGYQAYALEYLSLVLYVGSGFFFTSGAYASQLFLLLPMWIPAIAVLVAVFLATIAVFWVSKVGFETGLIYAIAGALVMAELYVALSTLPTSFVTNAATFSVFLYLFLLLSRAQVLDSFNRKIALRYIISAALLLGVILGTATWL
ncbi:MAG: hypothetical protein NUV56_02100 [Candidatus Uhrbacteria bacterium]|nr:hypothetical protein [Candidatus Uhrbacteria bacterium]